MNQQHKLLHPQECVEDEEQQETSDQGPEDEERRRPPWLKTVMLSIGGLLILGVAVAAFALGGVVFRGTDARVGEHDDFGVVEKFENDNCGSAGKWQNVGMIVDGYNIYYGNPLPTKAGRDNGFRRPLFKMNYARGSTNGAGNMCNLDGYDIKKDSGATVSMSSESISSTGKYESAVKSKSSMGVGVKVPGTGSGSFSMSKESAEVRNMMKTSTNKMIQSTAENMEYTAALQLNTEPETADDFKLAVDSAESIKDFYKLFDNYGTHMVTHIGMGSRFIYTRYISEDSWKQVHDKSSKSSLEAEASASAKGAADLSAKYGTSNEQSTNTGDSFDKLCEHKELVTLGKPVSGDGSDAMAWAAGKTEQPMPLKYELDYICNHPVFKSKGDKGDTCLKALNSYCSVYLSAQGAVCDAGEEPECRWDMDCGDSKTKTCETGKCVDLPKCTVKLYKDADYKHLLTSYGPFTIQDDRGGDSGKKVPVAKQFGDEVTSIELVGSGCKKMIVVDEDNCAEDDDDNREYGPSGIDDLPYDLNNDVCAIVVYTNGKR